MTIQLMITFMDQSGDGLIQFDEWLLVLTALTSKVRETTWTSPLEKAFPRWGKSKCGQGFISFIAGRYFRWIMDAVVLVDVIRPSDWDEVRAVVEVDSGTTEVDSIVAHKASVRSNPIADDDVVSAVAFNSPAAS